MSNRLNWVLENSNWWLMDCSFQCVQMKRVEAVLRQSPTNVKLDGVKYHTFFHNVLQSVLKSFPKWKRKNKTSYWFGGILCVHCVCMSAHVSGHMLTLVGVCGGQRLRMWCLLQPLLCLALLHKDLSLILKLTISVKLIGPWALGCTCLSLLSFCTSITTTVATPLFMQALRIWTEVSCLHS